MSALAGKIGVDFALIEPHQLQYEVEQLMRSYCECIDDDRLEDWPAFFTDDARYAITTRANVDRGLPANALSCDGIGMLRDRVTSLRHANVYGVQYYRHIVGNVSIKHVTAETLKVQSHYMVVRTLAREGEPLMFSVGKTFDTLVGTEDGLRFKRRKVVSDNDRIHTLIVLPI